MNYYMCVLILDVCIGVYFIIEIAKQLMRIANALERRAEDGNS